MRKKGKITMYEHYRVIWCTKTKVTDPLTNTECPNEKTKIRKVCGGGDYVMG
jgi:predicted RNA-binding protein with PUA domain